MNGDVLIRLIYLIKNQVRQLIRYVSYRNKGHNLSPHEFLVDHE